MPLNVVLPRSAASFGAIGRFGGVSYALLWLAMALGSFVMIEPAPYDFLLAGLIPLFLAAGLRLPRGFVLPSLCMIGLLFSASMSALFNGAPFVALRDVAIWALLLVNFAFLAMVVSADPKRAFDAIMNGYVAAALVAVVFGAVGYFGLVANADAYLFAGRAKGFFKDPNVFGPFLIPPALYLLSRLTSDKGWRAVFRLALFLLLVFGVLLSFSRGAWVNLVVSVATFGGLALFLARRSARTDRLMAWTGLAALLTVLVVAGALSSERIGELFETRAAVFQSYDLERGGRFYMQKMALREVLSGPFGVGPGLWHLHYQTDPHNVYLKVAASSGWAAGVLYLALVVLTVIRGFVFCRREWSGQFAYIAVYAAFVSTVLQGVQIDTDHWRHFYVLLALVWGPALALENRNLSPIRPAR